MYLNIHWPEISAPLRPHLSQVVKVVLVSLPFVFVEQAVRLVGDVHEFISDADEELPFEELRGEEHTIYNRAHTHVDQWISMTFK